jgi:hypothetical protein
MRNGNGALSREAQLLSLTTRSVPTTAALRQALDSNVNWPELVRLAQQEGATATLWRCLLRTGTDRVPRDIATQWEKLAIVSEFQMLHLERALHDVVDLLSREGIDMMLLKGSALAYTAYGSFPDRPMSDLDVLVPAGRARQAWSLLQTHGWTWPAARWPVEHYAAHQHLPPLIRGSRGETRLEIHTALLPEGNPFHWPVTAVWAGAQRLWVMGRSMMVPHPLDQLLHVCVHFAWSHEMRWGSWRTLRDVQVVTGRGPFAWDEFVALAGGAGAASCCYWTLRLARNLAGAAVPDAVLRALRPPRPEFILKRLENHYVRQLFATDSTCPSEWLSSALWELGIAPRSSGHGLARPWQVSERWIAAAQLEPVTPAWSRRLLHRARHAAQVVGYLGRITTMGRVPRPVSVSPTTQSVP